VLQLPIDCNQPRKRSGNDNRAKNFCRRSAFFLKYYSNHHYPNGCNEVAKSAFKNTSIDGRPYEYSPINGDKNPGCAMYDKKPWFYFWLVIEVGKSNKNHHE